MILFFFFFFSPVKGVLSVSWFFFEAPLPISVFNVLLLLHSGFFFLEGAIESDFYLVEEVVCTHFSQLNNSNLGNFCIKLIELKEYLLL